MEWFDLKEKKPTIKDAGPTYQVWVLGKNSRGEPVYKLENYKMVEYDPQYAIKWARTGLHVPEDFDYKRPLPLYSLKYKREKMKRNKQIKKMKYII